MIGCELNQGAGRPRRRSTDLAGVLLLLVVLAGVLLFFVALAGCGGNALLRSARLDLDRGADERAYEALSAEAREHPDDVDTLLLLAEAALATGRVDAAVDALDRAGARDPGGDEGVRRSLWREAFRPVRAVLDTLERASESDRARAAEALEVSARIRRGTPAVLAARALLALESGDQATAEAGYDAAITAAREEAEGDGRPTSPAGVVLAITRGAEIHARADRLDRAVELGRAAVEIAPDDVRAGYDLGVNLHRLGEARGDTTIFREASETFARVLDEIPGDVEARYNRALSLYRLGEPTEAEQEVLEVLRRAPWKAPAYHLFARLRLAQDDRDAATAAVMAYRALTEGTPMDVPESALDVSKVAGMEGRKRYVLDRPPDRILGYIERGGAPVEVWFWRDPTRVVGLSEGTFVAAARPGEVMNVRP